MYGKNAPEWKTRHRTCFALPLKEKSYITSVASSFLPLGLKDEAFHSSMSSIMERYVLQMKGRFVSFRGRSVLEAF